MTRTNERERVTIDDLNLEAYKGYLFVPNRFIQRELDTKSTYQRKSETSLYIVKSSILRRSDVYYKRSGAKQKIETFGIIYPSGRVQIVSYTRIIRSNRGIIVVI
ncbi:hypothetical protein GQR36_27230 [Enterococcus termitis]